MKVENLVQAKAKPVTAEAENCHGTPPRKWITGSLKRKWDSEQKCHEQVNKQSAGHWKVETPEKKIKYQSNQTNSYTMISTKSTNFNTKGKSQIVRFCSEDSLRNNNLSIIIHSKSRKLIN